METAKAVYARRGIAFDTVEENIFRAVFELTAENRLM
jgi:hypothetical protein